MEPITPADALRNAGLVETYADLGLGGPDASLTVLAERLKLTPMATLDHRHFGVVRPTHTAAFELVPEGTLREHQPNHTRPHQVTRSRQIQPFAGILVPADAFA